MFRTKRKYDMGRNWKYHQTLRSCQRMGKRLGTLSRTDGIWVCYLQDGRVYRFRKGRVVGPVNWSDYKFFKGLKNGD